MPCCTDSPSLDNQTVLFIRTKFDELVRARLDFCRLMQTGKYRMAALRVLLNLGPPCRLIPIGT